MSGWRRLGITASGHRQRSEEEVMEQVLQVPLPPRGSFGALVRAGRHRAFLSQEQLAERAELSERTVRNLEADRVRSPRAETVRLLADALELSEPEREGWFEAARGVNHEQAESAVADWGRPAPPPAGVPARMPMKASDFGIGNQHRRRRSPAVGFRAKVAELCRRGDGSAGHVARELALTDPAIPARVRRPGQDVQSGEDGRLSTADQCELAELRRENHRLREDLEILKRATTILATVT